MKKRLRKKLYLGEWQTYGIMVTFTAAPCTEAAHCHDLLDRFQATLEPFPVTEGGNGDGWIPASERTWKSWVYAVDRYASVTEEQRAVLEAWLKQEPQITSYTVGPLIDAHHRRRAEKGAATGAGLPSERREPERTKGRETKAMRLASDEGVCFSLWQI